MVKSGVEKFQKVIDEVPAKVEAQVTPLVAKAISADGTITAAAQIAVNAKISDLDLVESSDDRLPSHETIPGLSIALTDARGVRTHLEANDTDGGPTPYAMNLSGPALQKHMDFLTGKDPRTPEHLDVPGVSFAVTDAHNARTFLETNDTDGGPTPYSAALLRKHLSLIDNGTGTASFITDGDSITQGGHGGGISWQAVLSELMGGAPIVNSGVSGSTSVEIALKMGAWAPVITVEGNLLPADTSTVPVTLDNMPLPMSASGQPARSYTGTFEGVKAILSKSKENAWSIRRSAAGTAVPVTPRSPFLVDTLPQSATRIIWPGRNDYPKVSIREPIDRMAKWITEGGGKFLVASILTRSGEPDTASDYRETMAQNLITQELYPRNYVNIQGYLVRHGLDAAGVTPTEADLKAQSVNGIPPSLMFDGLHPNEAGRTAIGKYFHQQLKIRNML